MDHLSQTRRHNPPPLPLEVSCSASDVRSSFSFPSPSRLFISASQFLPRRFRPWNSNSFIPSPKAAGTTAINRWKSHPIGGEFRPEAWGLAFDHSPPAPVQNFDRSVTETHVSWLMDTGMFREKANPERHARALEAVRRMGYESRVTSLTLDKNSLELTHINQGVAPLYHPRPAHFGILHPSGTDPKEEIHLSNKITGALPGQSAV